MPSQQSAIVPASASAVPPEFISDRPKQFWMTIRPHAAGALLANMVLNRPVSRHHVTYLAQEMVGGHWRKTGEAIKVSASGKLLDGQHRLLACVETGLPFETMVVTGLEDGVQFALDRGRARTPADAVSMYIPVARASWVVPAARRVFSFKRQSTEDVRVSPERLAEYVRVSRISTIATDHLPSWIPKVFAPAQYLAFWALVTETGLVGDDQVAEFLRQMRESYGLPDGSPAKALMRWRERASQHNSKVNQRDAFSLLCRAWNAHMDGERVTRMWAPSLPTKLVGEDTRNRDWFQ